MSSFFDFTASTDTAFFGWALIFWSLQCIAFAIWKRDAGGVDAFLPARLFALTALPMWFLVVLSGIFVGSAQVSNVFMGDAAAAARIGSRLNVAALDAFGTLEAFGTFLAAMRQSESGALALAALGGLLMIAGGSAAAIHVWRATTADLPTIRWRHVGFGAAVTIAIWFVGLHLGVGPFSGAQRQAYRSIAEQQALRCPDLSTPCPLQRGSSGG